MGSVTGEQASVWRETSTYLGDTYVAGDPEDATPRFATQMATAAVRVAQECARLVDLELGTETDNSACIKELAARSVSPHTPHRPLLTRPETGRGVQAHARRHCKCTCIACHFIHIWLCG